MTMSEALRVYIERFAGSTRKTMTQRLKSFIMYVDTICVDDVGLITTAQIEQWLLELCKRDLKPWSVYVYLSAVRHLFTALHNEGCLARNPWPKHVKTKRPVHSIRCVPSSERMIEVLEAASRCSYPCRTRTILELGYGCGLRRMELCNLNINDIEGDTVRIRGKGGKERLVPLGDTARQWLEKYLYGERLQAVRAHNPHEIALFVSEYGKRLGVGSYEVMIRQIRSACSVKSITMHSLRHACATHMLRNGASIMVLSKLLGHEHVTTTEIYTKVTTDDLRTVLTNKHPRG